MYEVIQRLNTFYPLTDIYRMKIPKFNIGDIVWVKYNIPEYGDSIRTRIISDILVTNNWQGDISYFFLWTDKPSPIYENDVVWLYQKSSPSIEDKPIENEQDFWIDDTRLKKIIEATWYCIQEYWYINDLVCLENVKKHLD